MEQLNPITQVLFPYINFFLFLFLAIFLFRKPIAGLFKDRKSSYETLVREAKAAKEQAEARKAELERRISGLDEELRRAREEARKDAEREHAQAIESAEKLAQHLRTEAQKIAAAELDRARQGLEDQVVKTVAAEIAKTIASRLTPEEHTKIVAKSSAKLATVESSYSAATVPSNTGAH